MQAGIVQNSHLGTAISEGLRSQFAERRALTPVTFGDRMLRAHEEDMIPVGDREIAFQTFRPVFTGLNLPSVPSGGVMPNVPSVVLGETVGPGAPVYFYQEGVDRPEARAEAAVRVREPLRSGSAGTPWMEDAWLAKPRADLPLDGVEDKYVELGPTVLLTGAAPDGEVVWRSAEAKTRSERGHMSMRRVEQEAAQSRRRSLKRLEAMFVGDEQLEAINAIADEQERQEAEERRPLSRPPLEQQPGLRLLPDPPSIPLPPQKRYRLVPIGRQDVVHAPTAVLAEVQGEGDEWDEWDEGEEGEEEEVEVEAAFVVEETAGPRPSLIAFFEETKSVVRGRSKVSASQYWANNWPYLVNIILLVLFLGAIIAVVVVAARGDCPKPCQCQPQPQPQPQPQLRRTLRE